MECAFCFNPSKRIIEISETYIGKSGFLNISRHVVFDQIECMILYFLNEIDRTDHIEDYENMKERIEDIIKKS